MNATYSVVDQPSLKTVEEVCRKTMFSFLLIRYRGRKRVSAMVAADEPWKNTLKSHQRDAADFTVVNAFWLEKGTRKIFVVTSSSKELRERFSHSSITQNQFWANMTFIADGSERVHCSRASPSHRVIRWKL